MDERNSMLWWWPRVQVLSGTNSPLKHPINMPATTLIQCKEIDPLEWACAVEEGENPPDPPWMAEIEQAVTAHWHRQIRAKRGPRIGLGTCFLRGDEASVKHEFADTCQVIEPECTARHVFNICQWHLQQMFGPMLRGFAVRDWIEARNPIIATAYGNLPIGTEWRYYVRDGRVECFHPYWPEGAVEQGAPLQEDWRERLRRASYVGPCTEALLRDWAEHLGQVLGGGYWSVDFMEDAHGFLWFIDCALGECSWHDPSCEHAIPSQYEGV
ncbi:MAG TPA: hypothetical protein VM283_09820 [Armatimonadota bacterium]|nr:hypothetical protein [Armatimonadota bacterium]